MTFVDQYEIGFTGTREGMSTPQYETLCRLLTIWDLEIRSAHNGGCVGADEMFEELCDDLEIPSRRWPANNVAMGYVSRKTPGPNTAISQALPTHVRNEKIVLNSRRIIAAPKTEHETPRSGTWMTINMAKEHKVPTFIILPNGLVKVQVQ